MFGIGEWQANEWIGNEKGRRFRRNEETTKRGIMEIGRASRKKAMMKKENGTKNARMIKDIMMRIITIESLWGGDLYSFFLHTSMKKTFGI